MHDFLVPTSITKRVKFSSRVFIPTFVFVIALASVTLGMGLPFQTSASAVTYHTVTFVENDNSSDLVFTSQTSGVPTNLTRFVNLSPTFTNSGRTFLDWNTAVDGSGTSYQDAASFSFSDSIGLYAIWSVPFHPVTFLENDSVSDPISASQSGNSAAPLTLFESLAPSFSNSGYKFIGWNTEANGGGTSYGNGATFDFGEAIALYAVWQAVPTITEVFVANGGTGSVGSLTSPQGVATTLPSSAAFAYPGYTFIGWNTQANGGGTEFAASGTYTFVGNQTLYAQWTPDVYFVTFNYEGGTSSMASLSYTVGTPALLLPTSTYDGFRFIGWFTASIGGTLVGSGGARYTPFNSVQLFAQWVAVAPNQLSFDANGGIGTISAIAGAPMVTILVPSIDGISNSGFTFEGWNTVADGSGTSFAPGADFTISGDVTFFAQWIPATTDTLTFDANGGSGTVTAIAGSAGSTITLPGQTGLLLAGFSLSHWNTKPGGSGTSYFIGQTMTLSKSTVLYAQWSGHKPAALFGAVGVFRKNSASLTAVLKNQISRLALTVRSRKYQTVTLYGYTATTGLSSLNVSLSRSRARNVANFLRRRLTVLKVKRVMIKSAGEGAIAGESTAAFSRVEVFGV